MAQHLGCYQCVFHSDSCQLRFAGLSPRKRANLSSVEIPDEVILPALLSRVEQGRRFLCERIDGANGIRLELVARSARQADVIEGRRSVASICVRRDSGIRVDMILWIKLPGGYVVTSPAQEDGGVRLDEHEPIGLAPEHLQLGALRIAERSSRALFE